MSGQMSSYGLANWIRRQIGPRNIIDMADHQNKSIQRSGGQRFWNSPYWLAVLAFLAAAGLLMIYQHRSHLFVGNEGLIAALAICAAVLVYLFRYGRNDRKDEEGQ